MLLTADRDGKIPYLLPSGAPPTAITWSLYDRTGTAVATAQAVAAPTSYAVSSAVEGSYQGEATATCTNTPTGITVGSVIRVRDTWGVDHDCLCWGVKAKVVRLADFGGDASEIASLWCPEITIPIAAAYLDETGDGWRVEISTTVGGASHKTQVYFSTCLLSLELDISPREFIDYHPEATTDLAALERRHDWPRLVKTAQSVVEDRIRSMDRWYAAIMSPSGLRRCVAEAVHWLLAPSSVPEAYQSAPGEWLDRASKRLASAIEEAQAAAHYDDDQDGIADSEEQAPQSGCSYKEL